MKKITSLAFVVVLSLAPAVRTSAGSEQSGGSLGRFQVGGFPAASALPLNGLTLFKSYLVNGDYASAGVGVRGSGTGVISLAGVSDDADVVAAYLYWETLGNGQ